MERRGVRICRVRATGWRSRAQDTPTCSVRYPPRGGGLGRALTRRRMRACCRQGRPAHCSANPRPTSFQSQPEEVKARRSSRNDLLSSQVLCGQHLPSRIPLLREYGTWHVRRANPRTSDFQPQLQDTIARRSSRSSYNRLRTLVPRNLSTDIVCLPNMCGAAQLRS